MQTEAIHKANLTADRVQAPALGSFGVDNTAGLLAGARAVDPHRKRLHVLAFDADHHGSREEVSLARRLQEQGYRVALARWDRALGNGPNAAQARTPLTGRILFDTLDRRCGGQLAAWLGALTQHPEVTDPHPWPGGLDITDPKAAQVAAALPPVVLPQLWRALAGELGR